MPASIHSENFQTESNAFLEGPSAGIARLSPVDNRAYHAAKASSHSVDAVSKYFGNVTLVDDQQETGSTSGETSAGGVPYAPATGFYQPKPTDGVLSTNDSPATGFYQSKPTDGVLSTNDSPATGFYQPKQTGRDPGFYPQTPNGQFAGTDAQDPAFYPVKSGSDNTGTDASDPGFYPLKIKSHVAGTTDHPATGFYAPIGESADTTDRPATGFYQPIGESTGTFDRPATGFYAPKADSAGTAADPMPVLPEGKGHGASMPDDPMPVIGDDLTTKTPTSKSGEGQK